MDTLSSDGSTGPGHVSAHPICISDESSHSDDSDQVLSDDDLPPEIHVDLVSPASPPVSQCLPPEAPVVQLADSSAPTSPDRVRLDSTPDTLDVGPVFEASPDTTGFLMRLMDATLQATSGKSDCAPVIGEPVAFTLSGPIPGSDAPAITFPVYPLPSGIALLPVSRSA